MLVAAVLDIGTALVEVTERKGMRWRTNMTPRPMRMHKKNLVRRPIFNFQKITLGEAASKKSVRMESTVNVSGKQLLLCSLILQWYHFPWEALVSLKG